MNATPNTTQHPVPKSINDFRRLGLIGKWFGELQLVSVQAPRYAAGEIRNTICRITCAKGHRSSRIWWELRDQSPKHVCAKCRAAKPKPPANLSNEDILKKIEQLPPERRRLFDALMESRRRVAGQDETTPKDLLNDAYSYAKAVKDPEAELRDLLADGGYETYGRSASLRSPNWIYAGGE